MVATNSTAQAAIIFCLSRQTPTIQVQGFSTGTGCRLVFLFHHVPADFVIKPEGPCTLSFLKLLLQTAEEFSRLQRAIQIAYRESAR